MFVRAALSTHCRDSPFVLFFDPIDGPFESFRKRSASGFTTGSVRPNVRLAKESARAAHPDATVGSTEMVLAIGSKV